MRLFFVFCVATVLFFSSCAKNEPFLKPYTVPPTYTVENKDSSGAANVIMMQAMYNYLNTSISDKLDGAVVDSLWINRGKPFTASMVTDLLYPDSILNKMTSTNLQNNTSDADAIKLYADSMVILSSSKEVAGKNGIAGWQSLSTSVSSKKLFSSRGVAYNEVWLYAMYGALSAFKSASSLSISSTNPELSWDIGYGYCGLPKDYDADFDYTAEPLPKDRPLGISSLFWIVKNDVNAGRVVYEDFKRGKAALGSLDVRVAAMSVDNIKIYLAKTLSQTALILLNNIKMSGNTADKLYNLSKVYGLTIAFRYGVSQFTEDEYLRLEEIFQSNFYTLINDPKYALLSEAEDIIATAYDF